jgi:tRNA (guanine-N7-)-methyltransferase
MNRLKISLTRNIPNPNIYVKMLPEYRGWIYLEEEALELKARWSSIFGEPNLPLDLEIGCGNGFFFNQQVRANPKRNLLGIEIKYKPLVQTVRRIKNDNLQNGRGLRFNARAIEAIFSHEELNNAYIYFPDPWPRRSQQKNRLMTLEFLNKLFLVQKPGSFLDFKTDSLEYFNSIEKFLSDSPYEVIRFTRDLHQSEWVSENFMTAFERIFTGKGQPINYFRLYKPPTSNQF